MNYGMKLKSGANVERVNEGSRSRKKAGSRSREEMKGARRVRDCEVRTDSPRQRVNKRDELRGVSEPKVFKQ